jgi:transcriptional regulator with XRE-family HTH domain
VEFKENLRVLRKRLGLTQTQAAEKVGGEPFRSYQNWEAGSREPRLKALQDLGAAFGVTTDVLPAHAHPFRPAKSPPSTAPGAELEVKGPARRGRKGK